MQIDSHELRELMQDPAKFLHRQRIDLQVYSNTLQLPGRQVYGCWDPLTRTIALYQVDDRSDEQLAATLIHEICHAVSSNRDEDAINAFVDNLIDSVDTTEIHRCADALRGLIRRHTMPHAPVRSCEGRHPFFPGGITV